MFFIRKPCSGILKTVNMQTISIYKNLEITYQEFEMALLRLGYRKVPKSKATHYILDTYDSIISISHLNTPDRKMNKGEFAAQAFLMEMKGVLKEKDDIAKMIEQERLSPSHAISH
jgi:hypothetical protein